MGKSRPFSLYDIEEFLREAGAERINERAVMSLEDELETTVNELIDDARIYANYAGRTRLITNSDINLAKRGAPRGATVAKLHARKRKPSARQRLNMKLLAMNNR